MTLTELTPSEVAALQWDWDPRSPILGPPFPSPIIADPTFLPPDATPDRQWHLWAHSLLGVHHHVSDDGISWTRRETVQRNALRAQVVDLGAGTAPRYRLLYERTRAFIPFGVRWSSWIESRSSDDLRTWSEPSVLVRPSLPWHRDAKQGDAVSNPCLVPLPDGSWRLYVSAGLVHVPDCGFNEPAYIGAADGPTPDGPFEIRPEPLLSPDPADPWGTLGAGAMKVVAVRDGWVAFQNAIGWNAQTRTSSSAIRVLTSTDGLDWHVTGEPVLAPTGHGWAASHVYALDVRDTPDGVRLYANGRTAAHWTRGRERIGLARPCPD